nr:DUF3592 domain-containing protein [Actinacidiphila oryziradicis]
MRGRFFDSGGRAVSGGALVVDGLVGIDGLGGRRRVGIFRALLIVVMGAVFIVAGIFIHSQHQPYKGGVSATGTVSGVHISRDSKGHIGYSRVVGFTDLAGQHVSVTDTQSSSNRPATGTSVTLSYPKGHPFQARIIPGMDWGPWLLIGVGGLTSLIGVVTFCLRAITLNAAWRRRRVS